MLVAFEPYKKLTFRSYMLYASAQELARALAHSLPPGVPGETRIRWANGVAFNFGGFQPADSLVKEYIEGHLLWDHIDLTPMPEYLEEIRVPERPLVTIRVQNLSGHAVFDPLTKWLQENIIKKKTVPKPSR